MKKMMMVVVTAAVFVLAGFGVAQATPGTDVGSFSLEIKNVQVTDRTLGGITAYTIQTDCPAGWEVLTGHGGLVSESGGISVYNYYPGSKVDQDTWEVQFSGLSTSLRDTPTL